MFEIGVKAILGIRPLIGGHREQKIEIEEDTNISDLLDKLTGMYGESLINRLLDESKQIRAGIAMFLNGRNIFALQGLNTKLSDKDEFLIFPPVAGG